MSDDILRLTLEELAKDGNEKAQLALSLATKMAAPATISAGNRDLAVAQLQESLRELREAIYRNDTAWTQATDRHINAAQDRITRAISMLK